MDQAFPASFEIAGQERPVMKISILAVGKIKEDWLKKGIAEYRKRVSRFCEIEIIEIPDAPENDSIEKAMADEGKKMLLRMKDQDMVIALDVNGETVDSFRFSERLMRWIDKGGSKITILIGGSNGYMPEVLEKAAERIRLSDLTFPHQMTRLILMEQLFRAFKIAKNEKYHK